MNSCHHFKSKFSPVGAQIPSVVFLAFKRLSSSSVQRSSMSLRSMEIARKQRQIDRHIEKNFGRQSEVESVPESVRSPYRRSTPPAGLPLSKILSANSFPLSLTESFGHYMARHDLDMFQTDLLSTLPFYGQDASKFDSCGRTSEIVKTVIDDSGNYINEFVMYPPGYDPAYDQGSNSRYNHLVMVHGYGAGLGFFLKNFDQISAPQNHKSEWVVHAIDLLGYGCSSRPDFPHNEPLESTKVEDWFTQSLQVWFDRRGLSGLPKDKVMMCSHSMGAYITAKLNMKSPNLFGKVLMVSPAGINEVNEETAPKIPKWFELLWNQNVSPFALVRYTGPLGSIFVSGWTSRRFSMDTITQQEQDLLHRYTYAIFNAKGSGEYVLNYLLRAGGVPRRPLIREISKLKCDTVWLYGAEDWMDREAGQMCSEYISRTATHTSRYIELANAGHHLYLDDAERFNRIVIDEMNKMENV
ncbi:unnamed protein product [Kuraishia capsulata CBS 1993]|uniref:AB hydrolase-1 domain-containing protein n=1 Tax=Kuraishia capsulata CBS 1993 TaxID=1382522 RepID=W6MXJ2_9ASCO|nr:uncharacterized protein KUCA_T00004971001 [Kuraishia capsulata CBS 1993]CDK28985.1 unnamed protein product [Kuraishia capsulata CBS 1993]